MKTHLKTNSPPHKTNPANNSTTRFAIVAFLTLSSAIALPSCASSQPNTRSENQISASAPKSAPAPPPPAGEARSADVAKKTSTNDSKSSPTD